MFSVALEVQSGGFDPNYGLDAIKIKVMNSLFNPKLRAIPIKFWKIKLGQLASVATPTAPLVPRLPMVIWLWWWMAWRRTR
jgi:hypothetical protein